MGRRLRRRHSDVDVDANSPGCMWGILFFLDYHRWYNIKKMLSHRKHGGRKHARCCHNPETISLERDTFEKQALLFDGVDHFPVRMHERKSSQRSFRRADMKKGADKETSDEQKNGTRSSGITKEARLQQAHSDNQIEHSDHLIGEESGGAMKPISIEKNSEASAITFQDSSLQKNQENGVAVSLEKELDRVLTKSLSQSQVDVEQMRQQYMQREDVFEVFKVSKDLFLKVLQGTDFREQKNSNVKPRLAKSGSFPVPNSTRARFKRSSTLKHKQGEVWSSPRGQNSILPMQESEAVESKSPREFHEKSGHGQEKKFSSPAFSQGLINQGWSQLVMSRFKHIKQRIKHILMESNHTSSDAVLRGTPSPESSQVIINQTDDCDNNPRKGKSAGFKRTSSLNESVDKYNFLFDRGFSRHITFRESRSLKLTSEDRNSSHGKRSFKRNLSVPDLGHSWPHLYEVPHDSLSSGFPVEALLGHYKNNEVGGHIEAKSDAYTVSNQNIEAQESVANSKHQQKIPDSSESSVSTDFPGNFVVESTCEESFWTDKFKKDTIDAKVEAYKGEGSEFTLNSSNELLHPTSNTDSRSCFVGDTSGDDKFPVIKASEPDATTQSHDQDLSLDSEKKAANSLEGLSATEDHDNEEDANKYVATNLILSELDKKKTNFSCVKEILEMSGFTAKDSLGFWHSTDMPLNPLLLKELENHMYRELEGSMEEEDQGNCDHQLLFDLVNEVLVEIYEGSFTYFPRALFFNSRLRASPLGQHLPDEVWKRVSMYSSLRPELDESLDHVVAGDLARGDGWMNLQMENECVALEVEDWIFDELLEEIIS